MPVRDSPEFGIMNGYYPARVGKSFVYRTTLDTRTKTSAKIVRVLRHARYTNESGAESRPHPAGLGPFRLENPC